MLSNVTARPQRSQRPPESTAVTAMMPATKPSATAGREQCLGLLDDYPTRSGYVITPVVVKLSDGQRMTPNPAEVAAPTGRDGRGVIRPWAGIRIGAG
jgi:hypothetical protein